MNFQVGSKCDSANKEKDHIKDVEPKWQQRNRAEILIDRNGDEKYQAEHGEDRYEHAVVDDGRISSGRIMDHVSHKRHYEQCPEKLEMKLADQSHHNTHQEPQTCMPRRPI